jgi:hypothetical protein
VPAGGIGKEKAVSFLQAPFAEVLQLVGFAIPDKNDGEPAAALTAAAAGAGYWGRLGGFQTNHHRLVCCQKIVRGDQINIPLYHYVLSLF